MRLWCDRMSSPIGTVLFVSDGDALRALDFEDCEDRMHRLLRRQYERLRWKPAGSPAILVAAFMPISTANWRRWTPSRCGRAAQPSSVGSGRR